MLKRTRIKKKSKTPVALLKVELWELCKQITRKTFGNVCYSCGARGLSGSNWQTGHMIPSSVCSTELRYDLGNLRPQCARCNLFEGGNHYNYGKHLEKDLGEDYVFELKKRNEKTKGMKYDILWFQAKIEEYRIILLNAQLEPPSLYSIGRDAFAKISAVEGIQLNKDERKRDNRRNGKDR